MKGLLLIGTLFILVVLIALNIIRPFTTNALAEIMRPPGSTSSDTSRLLQPVSSSIRYVTYSNEVFDTVYQQQRVLFFFAPWCATCIAADEELSELSNKIPEGVIVFKVNYDTETNLREIYDVDEFHTFIRVDSKGKKVDQWTKGGVKELIEAVDK